MGRYYLDDSLDPLLREKNHFFDIFDFFSRQQKLSLINSASLQQKGAYFWITYFLGKLSFISNYSVLSWNIGFIAYLLVYLGLLIFVEVKYGQISFDKFSSYRNIKFHRIRSRKNCLEFDSFISQPRKSCRDNSVSIIH